MEFNVTVESLEMAKSALEQLSLLQAQVHEEVLQAYEAGHLTSKNLGERHPYVQLSHKITETEDMIRYIETKLALDKASSEK